MQSDARTPSEYIEQLEDDWRCEKLREIRALIMRQAPELEERIHYKMLGYGHGDNYVFHLNAQRHYVSLYVGNASRIDPDGALLKGLNVGKGCIRFTKTKEVAETRIDTFIARAIERWRSGEDIDC
ncbi:iron chaperone [Hoeflea sp.]|uniref:iron chaperone n=1 Tax=Hoeflea sp. TaxID=1940281 RepID=UPI003B017410